VVEDGPNVPPAGEAAVIAGSFGDPTAAIYYPAVPIIHPTAFIHPAAVVAGNVTLGARVSVWPTAVIRGDSDTIEIGDDSNVQDGTVIHVDDGVPTRIGKRVGIGHRAIIHGATIEDDCLIGMGAILLNGTQVGSGSIVAAGAVCREGFVIPPNSLAMGVPARIVRQTTAAERARIRHTVDAYLKLQDEHRAGKYPAVHHAT
jgi:carbonic anhydrase/acetyltransferase-like protein (isoleucine patch superfamily)